MSAIIPLESNRIANPIQLNFKYLAPLKKVNKLIERLGKELIKQKFISPDSSEKRRAFIQDRCFTCVMTLIQQPMGIPSHILEKLFPLTHSSGESALVHLMKQDVNCEAIKRFIDTYGKLLLEGENPLKEAIKLGKSWDFIYDLINAQMGSIWDGQGGSKLPVCIAIKKNKHELIELLIPKRGGYAYSQISYFCEKRGLTLSLIALAVAKGRIECLEELMRISKERISSVRVVEKMWTILHLAVRMGGQYEMLQHLLSNYSEEMKFIIDCQDCEGKTPLMYAAFLGHAEIIKLLLEKGADPKIIDLRGDTAYILAVRKKKAAAAQLLLNYQCASIEKTCEMEDLEYLEKNYKGNFYVNPPEGLIFGGGGAKAIAYVGAVAGLEKCDMLKNVKRIGGTSAGAITATLLALGLNAEAIRRSATKMNGENFFLHPFTSEKMKNNLKNSVNLKKGLLLAKAIGESVTSESPGPALSWLGGELLEKVKGFTGLFEAGNFLKWIEGKIAAKTGIKHCTFGELADLIKDNIKNNTTFKHLHVIATHLGSKGIVNFNSEDDQWKDLIISDAVRVSISLPIIFELHTLIYKINGKFCTSSTGANSRERYGQLQEDIKNKKIEVTGESYVDGGCLMNFPLNLFDQPEFNYRTLGFKLYSEEKALKKNDRKGANKTIFQQIMGIYKIFRHAEFFINQANADPRNENRVIRLDHQGIGTRDFHVTPAKYPGNNVVYNAEETTLSFFENQRQQISKAKRTTPPKKDESREDARHIVRRLAVNQLDSKILMPLITGMYPKTNNEKAEAAVKCVVLAIPILTIRGGQYVFAKNNFKTHKMRSRFVVLKSNYPELRIFDPMSAPRRITSLQKAFLHENINEIMKHIIYEDNKEYINTVSSCGIDINTLMMKSSIIHLAVKHKLYNAFEGIISIKDFQLKGKAHLDKKSNTILNRIAKSGDIKAIQILKRSEILNALKEDNRQALIIAAKEKKSLMIKEFLGVPGIDFTGIDPKTKRTFLYYLAVANLEEEFEDLIFKIKHEKTTIETIIKAENDACLDGKTNSIVFETKNHKILNYLIGNGITLDSKEVNTKKNILHHLVEIEDQESIRLFCEELGKKDSDMLNELLNEQVEYPFENKTTPKTPLILAVERDYSKIVKLLVESGADYETEVNGWRPIHWAKKSSHWAKKSSKSYTYLSENPTPKKSAQAPKEDKNSASAEKILLRRSKRKDLSKSPVVRGKNPDRTADTTLRKSEQKDVKSLSNKSSGAKNPTSKMPINKPKKIVNSSSSETSS